MSLVTLQNQQKDIMILVTGASGALGSATLDHLRALGVEAVGGTRTPNHAALRRIDFDDANTLQFDGVDTLVMISAGTAEDDVVIARHERTLQAAERDGVRHIVYTSLTAGGDHLGFALAHRWTEQHIRRGSIPWTILRNGLYAELIADLLSPRDGTITAAFGPHGVAAVVRDDLAMAAAKVATNPLPHTGKIYDLVGAETITAAQVAQALCVKFRPTSLEHLRASFDGAGMLPFQPGMLVSIHSAIAGGFLEETGTDLEALLERKPMKTLDFIHQALQGTVPIT